MFVVKYRKIFYAFSGTLVILSIVAMFVWGFNLGIDFKGGSVLEVAFTSTKPSLDEANASLSSAEIKTIVGSNYSLVPTGETGYILRTTNITPAQKTTVENALSQNGKYAMEEKQFDSIGPLLGQESKNKALIS
jgi:preprotein translocase subunit SecF